VTFSHPQYGEKLVERNVDHGLMAAGRPAAPEIADRKLEMMAMNITQALRKGDDLGEMRNLVHQSNIANDEKSAWLAMLDRANEFKVNDSGGSMYEVAIHADPERFLDWDAPIGAQPGPVIDAVTKALRPKLYVKPTDDMTGGQVYNKARESLHLARQPARPFVQSDVDVAGRLQGGGIPGIKYLDQGSRPLTGGEVLGVQKGPKGYQAKVRVQNRTGVAFNTPADMVTTSKPYATEAEAMKWAQDAVKEGTRNYVTFSDNIVEILRKYGLGGLGIGLGGLGGLGGMRPQAAPQT
jgi:hypothetical protein